MTKTQMDNIQYRQFVTFKIAETDQSCCLVCCQSQTLWRCVRKELHVHWLLIDQRIEYKLCLQMHSVVGNVATSYLNDMITCAADLPGRAGLRSASFLDPGQAMEIKLPRLLVHEHFQSEILNISFSRCFYKTFMSIKSFPLLVLIIWIFMALL